MTRRQDLPGPQFDDLVRRLRAWPVSAWRHGDREAAARRALQQLADLTAPADADRPVPDAGVHALADQLVVLVADARRDGADPVAVDAVLAELTVVLGWAGRG
ncbi:hypothetical protein [Nakamurella leprariae]|uniref:Uncharacterized protein n=1 Tax=Nakamurella leprariae TaxID=2803911 RepID=A0A938YIR1_9ACTN|nr:hypothetical protein [Nakamurella leprariae]MBM9468603.1 hypothetical protein [Nakamurella leprariae]